VEQGLAGGGDLPVVVLQRVVALDGGDDEDGRVQEHRQAAAVGGVVAHGLDRAAQGAGVLVVDAGTGVGGVLEGDGGPVEFGLQMGGGVEGQGEEGLAEGDQVGLRDVGGAVVDVVADAFGGHGGLAPRVGSAPGR
jgi:hypothetical protein